MPIETSKMIVICSSDVETNDAVLFKWFARFQIDVLEFYMMRNAHTYNQPTNATFSILKLKHKYA